MTNDNIPPDSRELTFTPPIMTQVALFPVSKPAASYIERHNGNISVVLSPTKPDEWIYGKTARLLFLYIQSKIANPDDPDVDRQNRTVTFRGSYRKFCEECGIAYGGKGVGSIEHTLSSLVGMTVRVTRKDDDGGSMSKAVTIAEAGRTRICPEKHVIAVIQFSSEFWRELVRRSVPLNPRIVKNLGNSARALDIYSWLSVRFHGIFMKMRMEGDTRKFASFSLRWAHLFDQFEGTDMPMKEFKRQFRESFVKVKDVWGGLSMTEREDGCVSFSATCESLPSTADGDVGEMDAPSHVHSAGCSHVRAVGESVFGDVLFESGGAAVFDGLCGRLAGLWNEAGDGADAVALAGEVLAGFEG